MDKKKTLIHYTFFLLAAALCLMLASRSSFLYPLNNWDDANSYFTMGKCMFRGFVPYRDLFDQKGILLYFIYGISSLISATPTALSRRSISTIFQRMASTRF